MMIRALLLISNMFVQPSAAKKMDMETHNLVIEKLEAILKNDPDPNTNWPVAARLADLYSERARLKFVSEQEQHCDECQGSRQDREKALKIYAGVLKKADPEVQEKIMLQMAQLHKINGNDKQAQGLLQQASSSRNYSPTIKGQAETGLGETAFRRGEFVVAEKHFRNASKNPETPNKGFVQYRLAWSLLNQGKGEEATRTLVDLLQQPDLLNESPSFHEDVSRDLATFLARGEVGASQIELLLSLSPEPSRKANLQYLGTECDRLGKRQSSYTVWGRFAEDFATDEVDKTDIQMRLAQLRLDDGHIQDSIEMYKQVAANLPKLKCAEEDLRCEDLSSRFKSYVTGWAKLTKTKPNPMVSEAYGIYSGARPQDDETAYRGGQLAMKLKEWEKAVARFQIAVNSSEPKLKTTEREKAEVVFEGGLLGLIEAAEAKKDFQTRIQAYDFYLQRNPTGKSVDWVQYQKAYTYYQANDYKTAALMFRDLAQTSADRKIRIQSADLALDSLVSMKQESQVPRWATDFSKSIPERRVEYARISRKALINESERVLTQKDANHVQQAEVFVRLKTLTIAGADAQEKASYYKNRMLLAERLKDLEDLKFSAQQYLKLNKRSLEDTNYAYSRLAWVAELQLSFRQAYDYTRKIKSDPADAREHELKLGLLAELSYQDARPHYSRALKATRSTSARNEIRAKLVRQARQKWPELMKQLPELKRSPSLLAHLALECFGDDPNVKLADRILDIRSVRKTPAGRTLSRAVTMRQLQTEDQPISRHRLNARAGDAKLQKAIKDRIRLLAAVEADLKRAALQQDWTLQIVQLNRFAKENQRFHGELLRLPTPGGLNAKQRKEYKTLIEIRADPFKRKHDEAVFLASQLWENEQNLERIKQDYLTANSSLQKIVGREMRMLSSAHPNSQKLMAWLTDHEKPSERALEQARLAVRQDPFNSERITNLGKLERQRGRLTLATYLDARSKNVAGRN